MQSDAPARTATLSPPIPAKHPPIVAIATGEREKAQDILAAIGTLKAIEREKRPATAQEKQALARFAGFGPLARRIFPKPNLCKDDPEFQFSGYKNAGWQVLGEELRALLTPEEYDSAKRTTFNQFFTSPIVMQAMHEALARLGVLPAARVLEPGCGIGNFLSYAPDGMRFLGVELDSISGPIARLLHPQADIRIENIRDTRLPALDAVIGNVPFADKIRLEHKVHVTPCTIIALPSPSTH